MGLFNPPGVTYDDHDRNDDIPFDLSNFSKEFFGNHEDEDFEEDWDEDDDSKE